MRDWGKNFQNLYDLLRILLIEIKKKIYFYNFIIY